MRKEEKELLLAEEEVMCSLEEHQVSKFVDFEEAVERLERRRLRELSGEELMERLTEQKEIIERRYKAGEIGDAAMDDVSAYMDIVGGIGMLLYESVCRLQDWLKSLEEEEPEQGSPFGNQS